MTAEGIKRRYKLLDPFNVPTTIIHERNQRSFERETPANIKLSMQLKESSEERRLINYQKYLHMWDSYESQVKRHFDYKKKIAGPQQNILKIGKPH